MVLGIVEFIVSVLFSASSFDFLHSAEFISANYEFIFACLCGIN